MKQNTIQSPAEINGVGLHSGKSTFLRFSPAPENHGIVFRKKTDQCDIKIKTGIRYLIETELCSTIKSGRCEIRTVEHLMAAINAFDIDNMLIEVCGDEIPIMDGSSKDFVEIFENVGLKSQNAFREFIQIDKEISFEDDNGNYVKLSPSDKTLFSFSIDFPSKLIGKQTYDKFELTREHFVKEIAASRTFGFMSQVEKLKEKGLIRGGSLENAIVIDDNDTLLNEEGLRSKDEFVRHKLLDAIGDISLAGSKILGHFKGFRSSHSHTARLLKILHRNKDAWHKVSAA